jgi:hypothetical protein
MPFEIELRSGLVHIKLHGPISADDLHQLAVQNRDLDATLEVTPDRVVDVSESASFSLHLGLLRTAAANQQERKLKNPFKAAIIAPTLEQYGLSRMYQMCNQHPEIKIMVFKEAASAYEWLEQRQRA